MYRFDKNKKKYLHISSLDNVLPTSNNCFFGVNLPQFIQPIIMKLLFFQGVSSSNTFGYNANLFTNQILYFPLDESDAGGSSLINIELPIGMYNAQTFCAVLGAAMTAASTVGAVYTLTPNLVTFKYVISSTEQFTIPWLDVRNADPNLYIDYPYLYSFSGFSPTSDNNAKGPGNTPNYSVPTFNYAATLDSGNYILETPYNYAFNVPSPICINVLEFPNNCVSSSQHNFNFILPNDTPAGSTYVWKTENSYDQILNLTDKQISTMTFSITSNNGSPLYQGSNIIDMLFEYYEKTDLVTF